MTITTKTVKTPQHSITIELSQREADFLRCIVGSITGSCDGPRGFSDEIYVALGNVSDTACVLFDDTLKAPDSWEEFQSRVKARVV